MICSVSDFTTELLPWTLKVPTRACHLRRRFVKTKKAPSDFLRIPDSSATTKHTRDSPRLLIRAANTEIPTIACVRETWGELSHQKYENATEHRYPDSPAFLCFKVKKQKGPEEEG